MLLFFHEPFFSPCDDHGHVCFPVCLAVCCLFQVFGVGILCFFFFFYSLINKVSDRQQKITKPFHCCHICQSCQKPCVVCSCCDSALSSSLVVMRAAVLPKSRWQQVLIGLRRWLQCVSWWWWFYMPPLTMLYNHNYTDERERETERCHFLIAQESSWLFKV